MGDPAGIGGEITLRAWETLRANGPVFFTIADPAQLAGSVPIAHPDEAASCFAAALPVLPIALAATPRPGRPDPANAAAIVDSIRIAVRFALQDAVSALCTNPISKAVLYEAGFAHPGHTEFLAELTEQPQAVMMLAAPELRVVPVTVHIALRRALDTLTPEAIVHAAYVTGAALQRDFGIATPRLAVAGLNPHAGEGGAMGLEESTIIAPAIAVLRDAGWQVSGPHPPDTLFTARARATYDAAICMYHDQALIPLKTLNMAGGVNCTLGLPIIRTSPDHGTAFDIAGQGIAEPDSLIAALRLAASCAANRSAAA